MTQISNSLSRCMNPSSQLAVALKCLSSVPRDLMILPTFSCGTRHVLDNPLHMSQEQNATALPPCGYLPFLGLRKHWGGPSVAKRLSSHAVLQWPEVHRFGSWAQTYTPLIKPCCGSMPHRRTRRTYN